MEVRHPIWVLERNDRVGLCSTRCSGDPRIGHAVQVLRRGVLLKRSSIGCGWGLLELRGRVRIRCS